MPVRVTYPKPTVGQQLQAFDRTMPSGVRTLQRRVPGSASVSDPELAGLRASAVNYAPAPAAQELATPLRAGETLSAEPRGSVADLSGRGRVHRMLDDAYGTAEELARDDPKELQIEEAKKDAALESFQIVQPGQQLPIRGGEARERRALQFETDLDTQRGAALQKELDTIDMEPEGPQAGDQQLTAQLVREWQVRPEWQKMTPEQRNERLYASIIEAKKAHKAARKRNILMKYELSSSGQIQPQYTE